MAQRNRPTPTDPATETTEALDIAPAAWAGRTGETREPHPQILAKLKESWDNRVVKSGKTSCPAAQIACGSPQEAKLRIRQLREAGAHLDIGVGIRVYDADGEVYPVASLGRAGDGEKFSVHFRARQKRGATDDATDE